MLNASSPIRHARHNRLGYSQRLMATNEIVIHKVQADCGAVILDFLRHGVG
jgi:hypothetical protein